MTIVKQDIALAAYEQVGTLKSGAEACGYGYYAAWQWVQRDTHHFRYRLSLAKEKHADHLEELMHSRLTDPQGNRGSDVLLMFDLKAKRPDVYRELPVILGSDQSREVLARLSAMMQAQLAAPVAVEAPRTIEAQVREMLPPGRTGEDRGQTPYPPVRLDSATRV